MYNGVGFSFREPEQLPPADRLLAVEFVRQFERNSHKFISVDKAALQERLHPKTIRKDTPVYPYPEGPTRYPSLDDKGRLLKDYGNSKAELDASTPPPRSSRASGSVKKEKPSPSKSATQPSTPLKISIPKSSSSKRKSPEPVAFSSEVVAKVNHLRSQVSLARARILEDLVTIRQLSRRETRQTKLEFGAKIEGCDDVRSFKDLAAASGYHDDVLELLRDAE